MGERHSSRLAREVIAGLPPLVLLLNSLLHGFRARIVTLPASHILRTAMEQKWNNPVYAAVLRKTRPAHLPSDVPFRRLRTHLVKEQFEYASDAQRPGQRVQDLYQSQVTVDTSSPKKHAKTFKAHMGRKPAKGPSSAATGARQHSYLHGRSIPPYGPQSSIRVYIFDKQPNHLARGLRLVPCGILLRRRNPSYRKCPLFFFFLIESIYSSINYRIYKLH